MAHACPFIPEKLYTERLQLERFTRSKEQVQCALDGCNGEQSLELQGDFGFKTPEDFLRFLDPFALSPTQFKEGIAGKDICCMIRERSGGPLIGMVSIGQRKAGTDFLPPDIGWLLVDGAMRKGYATEAAKEFLRFCQEDLGIKDITVFMNERNKPSTRVAEKLGFVDGGQIFIQDEGLYAPIFVLPHMDKIDAKGPVNFKGQVEEWERVHGKK